MQTVGEVFAPVPGSSGLLALCNLQLPTHDGLRRVFEAFLAQNPPSGILSIPMDAVHGWLDVMYPTLQAILYTTAGQPLLLTSPYSQAACGYVP